MSQASQTKLFARLSPALGILVFGLLGFLAVVRVLHIVRDFTSPTELTFPNSVMVHQAREYQHGRPMYTDFRQPPHVLTLYGPLLYVIPGLVGRLIQADEVTLFFIGRVISLLGTFGALAATAWLLRRAEKLSWTAVIAGLLIFFSAPIQWPVCMVFRADPMEMAWTLCGLALFVRGESTSWRWMSLPAFLVAFFYKQSGVVGPAAVVVYLLVNRRFAAGMRYAAAAAVAYATVIVGLNLATSGAYWLNCVTALRANVTWSNAVTIAGESAFLRCFIPFAPAVGNVMRRWSRHEFDLLSIFFVVSFAVGAMGTLRDGSADNYFLASLAAATVLAAREGALWFPGLLKHGGPVNGQSAAKIGGFPVSLAALTLISAFFLPAAWREATSLGNLMRELSERRQRDVQRLAFVKDAAARLDALGGPVLCQFDPVNLYTRNSIMMDTLTFAGLADQGIFDDRVIVQFIRDRRMAAVVLLFPLSARPVPRYQSTAWVRENWLHALRDAGYQEIQFGPLFIYTPPSDEN